MLCVVFYINKICITIKEEKKCNPKKGKVLIFNNHLFVLASKTAPSFKNTHEL